VGKTGAATYMTALELESVNKRYYADLATGRERQMTTGGRAEKYGLYSNLTIFGYLYCARRRQVKFPLSCLFISENS